MRLRALDLMPNAFVNARVVPLDDAVAEAARLLERARLPVIAELATDIAGARAAIRLAERIGGVIDHGQSDVTLKLLNVLRSVGLMVVSPGEAKRRCDLLVLAGNGFTAVPFDLPEDRVIRLKTPEAIAVARARIANRPVMGADERMKEVVERLTGAKFGVATWQPSGLDEPGLEMLIGLVKDLNAVTRFSTLSPAFAHNAWGIELASGWLTGFPARTSLARGIVEHDPWTFSAQRLIASGEADAVLWVSSFPMTAPARPAALPLVALGPPATAFAHEPDVFIEIGRPGTDHDGVLYRADTGGLAHVPASALSDAWCAGDIIARIASACRGA